MMKFRLVTNQDRRRGAGRQGGDDPSAQDGRRDAFGRRKFLVRNRRNLFGENVFFSFVPDDAAAKKARAFVLGEVFSG